MSTVARTRLETGALRITLSLINISHLERYATNEREKEPAEREREREKRKWAECKIIIHLSFADNHDVTTTTTPPVEPTHGDDQMVSDKSTSLCLCAASRNRNIFLHVSPPDDLRIQQQERSNRSAYSTRPFGNPCATNTSSAFTSPSV